METNEKNKINKKNVNSCNKKSFLINIEKVIENE